MFMKNYILFIGVATVIFGVFIHQLCPIGQHHSPQKITIVCTTGMIADVVGAIAGDGADVHCLMGPGIDPHSYRATARDVELLISADLIIYNGLHLEGKMAELLPDLSKNNKKVVAVGNTLAKDQLIDAGGDDLFDPHIWHDVLLWRDVARIITTALKEFCPERAQQYDQNSALYVRMLENLHIEINAVIQSIPEDKRILVTAHDAFSYFGRAYGFEVVGLQGISTDVQVGVKDVVVLAQYIVEHKVPVIFMESCVPRRALQAVQQAVQANGHTVILCDELFADALGPRLSGADNYVGMMRHNVMTIVNALSTTTS
jgi:manganese/zinc/iron transport system substrate-binding protein